MQVLVKFVNQPQEGKKMGNIKTEDGSTLFFDPKKHSFEKGKVYEVTTSSREWQGKTYTDITGVQQISSPKASPQDYGLGEPELRFISNVVGQAILAKTISDPDQVSLWAKAARATLKELA